MDGGYVIPLPLISEDAFLLHHEHVFRLDNNSNFLKSCLKHFNYNLYVGIKVTKIVR